MVTVHCVNYRTNIRNSWKWMKNSQHYSTQLIFFVLFSNWLVHILITLAKILALSVWFYLTAGPSTLTPYVTTVYTPTVGAEVFLSEGLLYVLCEVLICPPVHLSRVRPTPANVHRSPCVQCTCTWVYYTC